MCVIWATGLPRAKCGPSEPVTAQKQRNISGFRSDANGIKTFSDSETGKLR